MKFTRESNSATTIRQVDKGQLRIGDETITDHVILFRDSVTAWSPESTDNLTEADLADLIAAEPEIIIFGTGWQPGLPPRELVFALARKGIGFEVMDTPAACRTFNILISEDRDVAAVLLVS
jgi:uncharacterized protein